jgi:hypothetical protein
VERAKGQHAGCERSLTFTAVDGGDTLPQRLYRRLPADIRRPLPRSTVRSASARSHRSRCCGGVSPSAGDRGVQDWSSERLHAQGIRAGGARTVSAARVRHARGSQLPPTAGNDWPYATALIPSVRLFVPECLADALAVPRPERFRPVVASRAPGHPLIRMLRFSPAHNPATQAAQHQDGASLRLF